MSQEIIPVESLQSTHSSNSSSSTVASVEPMQDIDNNQVHKPEFDPLHPKELIVSVFYKNCREKMRL